MVNPLEQTNPWVRFFRRSLFVCSAALVALALHQSVDRPWVSFLLLVVALLALIPPWISRRRFRRLLLSGDAQGVVDAWRQAIESGTHDQAVVALVSATAFAAYGWVEEARSHLSKLRRGPLWLASTEHRLFVETLLEAFDGDRDQAVRLAEAMGQLPVPPVNARLRKQVLTLRGSLAALTRAFAHSARQGDLELLEHVAKRSPMVSWAMRYAAAVIAVDRGERWRVPRLLADAPAWPPQSAFKGFHTELLEQMRLPEEAADSKVSAGDRIEGA